MADPKQKGIVTFDKYVALMEEVSRTEEIEETGKRLTEWRKAFCLFEIKVMIFQSFPASLLDHFRPVRRQ